MTGWIRFTSAAFVFLFFAVLLSGTARASFCDDRSSGRFLEVMNDEAMRLPLRNRGGIANGGVCWWHSRFQRAAWYLARFEPAAPKPGESQRASIIHRLAARNEVVAIPGYANLEDFGLENEKLIQRELERWQIRDAVLNQAYLRGLSGQSSFRDPGLLRNHLDRLFERYREATDGGDVLWVMLQMRGITSHASLIRSMIPFDGGYLLEMIDSNFPREIIRYRYRFGDHSLMPENGYHDRVQWIPYAGLDRDTRRIRRALVRYCSVGGANWVIDDSDEEAMGPGLDEIDGADGVGGIDEIDGSVRAESGSGVLSSESEF